MSRVGKLPITVPQGVKVAINGGLINVEGPKGKLSCPTRPEVVINMEESTIKVLPRDESKESNSFQGLYRQLVNNMVIGVSKGFSKTLIINGVGFRADLKANILTLNLGYSELIEVVLPQGITATVENPNRVTISGIDKQLVGQTCAEIRSLREPEPYKGKGIRYEDEVIRRKAGKTASAKK
ncbi:50S ribosomal protein L6 [Sphaerochaeta halotolerans]|jgi:large subunit ribosomal protein L6|uniref:Large ribosomal subunit protein uL6 n=1 Tax=Sphaerochaeta halotolerans TaxID=2293840 RepID=A0A372MIB4_9SPIR|nr:50S ribosomal protein L6 [Sphaerochaeta halotolerans]MBG0766010.1 50S ribosomal protein L6 [Spirochaetaceae bacterium]MDK2858927.1 large subunit ribosomal protein [Sphaerochaeta sp.]MDN5333030.1 large subunit ribosomal protein [Sphaerochaeta sp.]MXI87144.1 50S ribosomal protein L6 [Sphaerochaeta halotolerans]RFU95499.1 50S ribosomal protein L6 [Sphaerochaeta halotolerans]